MENVVYMLTNKINGKQYVGSTFNLKNRIKYYKYNHKYMTNASLKLDIEKYGFDNFDIQILEQTTRDKLRDREKYYIQKYNLVNNGYNMTEATKPKDLITEYNRKMWQNEEYREKKSRQSSKLQKERLKNPEYLKEKSNQLKNATNKMKKKIGMYKNDKLVMEFNGIREAGRWLIKNNMTKSLNASSVIVKVLKGHTYRKTAYGYVWKYL